MLEIFERLIGFDTISSNPNIALMGYVVDLLAGAGIEAVLIKDSSGGKANLYASVGPKGAGGVMLSGHTDVVPIEGQAWSVPAFQLTAQDGRYYGRGAADMKGFVACAIDAMLAAAKRPLKVPLHLALSYDEEIGCMGVGSLIEMLAQAPLRPRMCLVGEPTGMQVATGHKGKNCAAGNLHRPRGAFGPCADGVECPASGGGFCERSAGGADAAGCDRPARW